MNTRFNRTLLVLLSLLCAAPAWSGGKLSIDSLVVFGDSLSDPGNAFYLTGNQSVPPYDNLDPVTLVPDAPYAKGGHHFSNGITWIEQVAKELKLGKDARPAFQVPGALNYAIGGSTARPRTDGPFLGLQIGLFLDTYGSSDILDDAVVVIVVSGNDLFDALEVALTGGNPVPVLNDAVQSIVGDGTPARPGITALCQAGARNFLIGNAPDIGLTPAVYRLAAALGNPGVITLASGLAENFNTLLAVALDSLPNAPCGDIQIADLDLFGALRAVVASGELNTNPPLTCVTPGEPPFTCNRNEEFFFQDGIHPTVTGHAVFAEEARGSLKSLIGAP